MSEHYFLQELLAIACHHSTGFIGVKQHDFGTRMVIARPCATPDLSGAVDSKVPMVSFMWKRKSVEIGEIVLPPSEEFQDLLPRRDLFHAVSASPTNPNYVIFMTSSSTLERH